MKRLTGILLCLFMALSAAGCARTEVTAESIEQTPAPTGTAPAEVSEEPSASAEPKSTASAEPEEEGGMKLFLNDTEIPVTWEDNAAVEELAAQAAEGDITVAMSMYGGWEQVGSLGRNYTRDDTQMTAVCGDIVLYGGNQIVVFYGSNAWSYTKLGRMELPESELTELLSNGGVTLTLGY